MEKDTLWGAVNCQYRLQAVEYHGEVVISYAQNYEDVLLSRVFRGKRSGLYIDIGAGDPNWDNVTRWFYGIGWRGINIEPNPQVFCSYSHQRPDDINLNVGIARQHGRATFFQVHPNALGQGWGLSSFDPAAEDRARALGFDVSCVEVPVVSLQSIVDEYCDNVTVDFIKIDVEGFEASVLGSVDWTKFRPAVVCVEAVRPNSAVPSFPEWEDTLVSKGYLLGLFDGVNNYYVDHSRLDILSQFNASVNCNDRFRRATAEDLPVHRPDCAGVGIQWGEGFYGLETEGPSTWR